MAVNGDHRISRFIRKSSKIGPWQRSAYTHPMPRYASRPKSRSMAKEQDILKQPPPKQPPPLTSRRIGIHTSGAGGVANAAERAYRLGCNTFQIFSSSPRQWAPV